jgi:hypothetical protein
VYDALTDDMKKLTSGINVKSTIGQEFLSSLEKLRMNIHHLITTSLRPLYLVGWNACLT